MSQPQDAFKKSVSVDINGDTISIKNLKNTDLKVVFYVLGLIFLAYWIYTQGMNVGALFLLAVFGVVAFLAYQELRISIYRHTVLDLKQKSVLRKSPVAFIKAKKYNFRKLNGISMSTQAVGGYTSAYEDETTDYEKTVILETESGDVPLLNFVSRKEEAEESLSLFIETIQTRLKQASAS